MAKEGKKGQRRHEADIDPKGTVTRKYMFRSQPASWHFNVTKFQRVLEKDRGFQNPQGIGEGYRGVGVRVHILLPPTNPYLLLRSG